MKTRHLFVILGIILTTAAEPAASTVEFSLIVDETAGTFKLFACDSLFDNFGIASYGVPLIGSILTIDHNSPNGFRLAPGPVGNVGFSLLRSADNNLVVAISASQDTLTPSPNLVYGFGQTGGNLAVDFAPTYIEVEVGRSAYSAPLLLAMGTYDKLGTKPDFNLASLDLGANTFDAAGGIVVSGATILTGKVLCPEPGTASLSLLGFALVMSRRRRTGAQS